MQYLFLLFIHNTSTVVKTRMYSHVLLISWCVVKFRVKIDACVYFVEL